jgi:hypothetical protein
VRCQAVFITVGCGATTWGNGELRPLADDDLRRKTEWARKIVSEQFGTLDPFSDEISLGAKAPLPRAFEKATALARRLPVEVLKKNEIRSLLVAAAERLRAIYEAQRTGRDLVASDLTFMELTQLQNPCVLGSERVKAFGFRMMKESRSNLGRCKWFENGSKGVVIK